MTASGETSANDAYSSGRWAASCMGCPSAEAPNTQTVRFRSGGSTGSQAAWALAGRRLEPSASTSTKSAAYCQPGKDNLVGLDPNLALFAAGFLLYAVFNAVFLPSFYANGYKVGVAFVKAIIPTTLAMIVFEALPHVPGLMWLDDMDAATQVRLLPYFVAAVLLYGIGTVLTFRRAAAQYEKVDL